MSSLTVSYNSVFDSPNITMSSAYDKRVEKVPFVGLLACILKLFQK